MVDRLMSEDQGYASDAYSVLSDKRYLSNPEARVSAQLTILSFGLRSGKLHPTEASMQRAMILDNIAFRYPEVAKRFRQVDPNDIEALYQPLRSALTHNIDSVQIINRVQKLLFGHTA